MNPSSSSSQPPGGPGRGPPPPGAQAFRQMRPQADPLVARKKRAPRPPPSRPPPKTASGPGQNGFGSSMPSSAVNSPSVAPGSSRQNEKLRALEAQRAANGGWSQPPPTNDFKEYPLVLTKRALREGIRYHVMRFNRGPNDKPVDPTDQEQFPRPVSLHRRDPKLPPAGRMVAKDEDMASLNPADEAEADRQRQLKAEREAQRAIDMAQIAPVAKANEPKPTKQLRREKAVSSYRPTETAQSKKQLGLRYEETLPWHLEDVEGKNVWVGSYVAALSEVNVALVISGGGFRMIPLERYYRFNAKPTFHRFTLEEAERVMGKNANDVGRWVMKDKERVEAQKEFADYRKFLGGPARVKIESSTSKALPKSETRDDHDLDISGDEFQDDDEAPGFEADDEDSRDAKDRVRRDHLGANIFGQAEEEDVDKAEEEERLEKMREKIQGKRTRRNLAKLEHAMEYDRSESESDNPFAESSSDSDEEDDKKDEKKDDKKDEKKDDKKDEDEEAKKPADDKGKPTSGSNTKGNTTPSGGKQKATDVAKKAKSLKRPGSPNLSESSGNESSRKKKVKKTAAAASVGASRSGTPLPGRPKPAGGAASDGEATAGEGSDGGLKPKKIKLKPGTSARGTPAGSRAGSPAPVGNKPTSPTRVETPRGSPPPGSPTGPVQAWEIVQALESRAEGISLGELLRMFSHRVESEKNPHLMKRQEWITLVRQNATYGPDKLVRPKAKPST